MKYWNTYSIHFRTKVGWSNVLLTYISWKPEIDQKGQNHDSFFVKFETTPWTVPKSPKSNWCDGRRGDGEGHNSHWQQHRDGLRGLWVRLWVLFRRNYRTSNEIQACLQLGWECTLFRMLKFSWNYVDLNEIRWNLIKFIDYKIKKNTTHA